MNRSERFIQWAAAARREPVPPLDVRAEVLRRLGGGRPHSDRVSRWLLAFSGLSAIAASITAMLAFQAWELFNDPLAAVLHSLTMVIL